VRYGFLVASGAFWAVSGAKRRRVTRCGLVRRSVRAPPYAPADGARAVGLLAGVCPASGAVRVSGAVGLLAGAGDRFGTACWFRQQVPEHDTKRATQPISVNLARVSKCQDRRKTAPSAAAKKPRRFPSLAARFFTIRLNSKKSRRVLTRRARATQSRIGCVARLISSRLAGTGVIEAVQAFGCRMSRPIRNFKPSRWYGCDRSGAGVSYGASAARSG